MHVKPHNAVRLLSFAVLFGLLLAFAQPAQAASVTPETTILTLSTLKQQSVGTSFTIDANLATASGAPIQEGSIAFYANENYLGRARLEEDGSAAFQVRDSLKAGYHRLRAEYNGTRAFAPSGAGQNLLIRPAYITVQTKPAMQGVTFKFNDGTYRSDANGVASIPVSQVGKYRLEVVPETANDENTRVSFGRWMDESFAPYREINVRGDDSMQVGLFVEHKVSLSFVDREGKPVPPERISAISLKNVRGDTFELQNGQPRFFPGAQVARRLGGLDVTELQYSVMSVTVDGSNVVNQAQQRFYTSPGDNWQVSLLLFSVQISARDAFFGFPVGSGATLTYPNGREQQLSFGTGQQVALTGLARGIYHVGVSGVKGYAPATPVALSQDQVVSLVVLTWVDLLTLSLAGAALAIGLLYAGRPELFRQAFGAVSGLRQRLPGRRPAPEPHKKHRHRHKPRKLPEAQLAIVQQSPVAPAKRPVDPARIIAKIRTEILRMVSDAN